MTMRSYDDEISVITRPRNTQYAVTFRLSCKKRLYIVRALGR